LLNRLNIFEDVIPVTETLSTLLPLGRQFDLSAYDAAYLGLAFRHGAHLVTLDAVLQKAAEAAGIRRLKV
jgi:predicted nucleic acid-binding protein